MTWKECGKPGCYCKDLETRVHQNQGECRDYGKGLQGIGIPPFTGDFSSPKEARTTQKMQHVVVPEGVEIVQSSSQAYKEGIDSKLMVELIPVRPLLEIAEVYTEGAAKVGARNWEKGIPWTKAYAGILRHLFRWVLGQDIDPKTGKKHLSHAGFWLFALLEYSETKKEFDDRNKIDNDLLNRFFKES